MNPGDASGTCQEPIIESPTPSPTPTPSATPSAQTPTATGGPANNSGAGWCGNDTRDRERGEKCDRGSYNGTVNGGSSDCATNEICSIGCLCVNKSAATTTTTTTTTTKVVSKTTPVAATSKKCANGQDGVTVDALEKTIEVSADDVKENSQFKNKPAPFRFTNNSSGKIKLAAKLKSPSDTTSIYNISIVGGSTGDVTEVHSTLIEKEESESLIVYAKDYGRLSQLYYATGKTSWEEKIEATVMKENDADSTYEKDEGNCLINDKSAPQNPIELTVYVKLKETPPKQDEAKNFNVIFPIKPGSAEICSPASSATSAFEITGQETTSRRQVETNAFEGAVITAALRMGSEAKELTANDVPEWRIWHGEAIKVPVELKGVNTKLKTINIILTIGDMKSYQTVWKNSKNSTINVPQSSQTYGSYIELKPMTGVVEGESFLKFKFYPEESRGQDKSKTNPLAGSLSNCGKTNAFYGNGFSYNFPDNEMNHNTEKVCFSFKPDDESYPPVQFSGVYIPPGCTVTGNAYVVKGTNTIDENAKTARFYVYLVDQNHKPVLEQTGILTLKISPEVGNVQGRQNGNNFIVIPIKAASAKDYYVDFVSFISEKYKDVTTWRPGRVWLKYADNQDGTYSVTQGITLEPK